MHSFHVYKQACFSRQDQNVPFIRIKMITKGKRLWSFIKFSQLSLQGNVWISDWRICMWILGLNGLVRGYQYVPLALFMSCLPGEEGVNLGGECKECRPLSPPRWPMAFQYNWYSAKNLLYHLIWYSQQFILCYYLVKSFFVFAFKKGNNGSNSSPKTKELRPTGVQWNLTF